MDLNRLTIALDTFAEIDPEMQLPTILTFLFIAQRGVCTQKDVELTLGLSNSAASRNVSYWTDRRFDRKPGVGFVSRTEDEFDRRLKNLTLTDGGVEFLRRLREV